MTTTSTSNPSVSSSVTIKCLASVEDELIDRILRERGGRRIFSICRDLCEVLYRNYSGIATELNERHDELCESLARRLACTRRQAVSLVELTLNLLHARVHGSYRRPDLDLGGLVASACGAEG